MGHRIYIIRGCTSELRIYKNLHYIFCGLKKEKTTIITVFWWDFIEQTARFISRLKSVHPVYYILLFLNKLSDRQSKIWKLQMSIHEILLQNHARFFHKFRLKSSDYYVNLASGLFFNTLIPTVSYTKKIRAPREPINNVVVRAWRCSDSDGRLTC